ncbi:MAG TPA: FlgO family outer membrane protein [Gemmatimonadaceae bacterium]|nr:FlgO family outer membrane protein [Gemmatimonadaceae bacterium]
MLRLTTFGGLALSRDGTPLTGAAAQRSRLSLLALLATAGPTGFSRDKLLLYLWPESDEERARHALKQAVYSLRRELGSDEVIVGTASLSLNPLIITSDAREFETAVAANDLATAVSLYTGPFLDGFHLKDSTEFERWSAEQRSRFAHMWVSSVERLAGDCESRGAWRDAAGHWRTLAAAEPLSGRLALALIRCLAESGDLGAALQQYKIHETLLREELGASPEAAVAAFAESLRAGTWTRTPDRAAARTTPLAPVTAAAIAPTADLPVFAPAPGVPPEAPRHAIGSARKRRRRTTALAFVLGMLLMTAAALTMTYATMDGDTRAAFNLVRSRPGPHLEPRQIVVAPFENRTNDSTLDVLGEQVADWFARELSEAGFRVVDSRTARIGSKVVERIPKPFRARDDAVALGEETESEYAVVGAYDRYGDSLQANVSVIDVATKHTLKGLGPFHGSSERANDLIVAMLQPTIAYLGAEVDTTAGGLTTRYSSPPSLEAFRRVNAAWEHFFRSPRDTTSIFVELDSAARLDASYATPLLMKAYILDVKSQWPGVNEIVQRVRPLAPRMSKIERAALELFEADLKGDGLARLDIARRLQALTPGSAEMPLLRVVSALYIGHVSEALAALSSTEPTRGMNLVAPTYLEWSAAAYHHAGQASLEEKAVREELKRFRHHPPATYGLARIYAARNDRDLRKLLDEGIPPAKDPNDVRDPIGDRVDLRLMAGRELRAHGHAEEARALFRDLATELAGTAVTAPLPELRRQARAFYEAEDYPRARAAFEAVLARDSTDLEAEGRIATAAVRLGDAATAKRIDEHLRTLRRPFLMGGALRWRAAIASAQGRTADAVSLLDQAVRQGLRLMDTPQNLTVHADADFVGIEKTPAYKAMLQALADASAVK